MIRDTPFRVTAPQDRSPLANNSLPLCHFLPGELLHFIYLPSKSLLHDDGRRSLGVNRKLWRVGGWWGRRSHTITIQWTWGMHPGFSPAYVSRPGKVRVLFILRAWALDFGSDRRLRGTASINNTLKNLEPACWQLNDQQHSRATRAKAVSFVLNRIKTVEIASIGLLSAPVE